MNANDSPSGVKIAVESIIRGIYPDALWHVKVERVRFPVPKRCPEGVEDGMFEIRAIPVDMGTSLQPVADALGDVGAVVAVKIEAGTGSGTNPLRPQVIAWLGWPVAEAINPNETLQEMYAAGEGPGSRKYREEHDAEYGDPIREMREEALAPEIGGRTDKKGEA